MDTAARPHERPVTISLFVTYLVLLVWIVLWKLDVPYVGAAALMPRPIKLVPFLADGTSGASNPVEVIVNVALFVPFGVYLGALAPAWRWWSVLGVAAATSVAFEITQYLISVGSADITDVITNTTGALLGFGLLALLRRRAGLRTPRLVARAGLAATALSLVAVAAFLVLPFHYAPQHDVIVHRTSS